VSSRHRACNVHHPADEEQHSAATVLKKSRWLVAMVALVLCFLTYERVWYRPLQVPSHIFGLDHVFTDHTSDIWAVAFSPDGRLLASGSVDSTVMIWSVETKELAFNLRQPAGITYLDFSPDGHSIATTGYDAVVRIWRIPEGTLTSELKGHRGTAWTVCFSPDGTTIATAGEDSTIKIWDVNSGAMIRTLSGHTRNVWDVKFSPDGKTLASGSFDQTIRIWNVADGALMRVLNDHSQAVVALAFSHDGRLLASTSDDTTVRLWRTAGWSPLLTLEVLEHAQAVAFSPDDRWLLTGGRDHTTIGEFLQNVLGDSQSNKGVSARLWDVGTGKMLQTFSEHANDVNDVAFSPDGRWIATGSSDHTVELWALREPRGANGPGVQ
jgi:WD40 repeat protein